MTFNTIPASDIEAGDAITHAVIQTVKEDLDDLNARVSSSGFPIGTIVHSMLTLAQFQSLAGTSWVLANGGSCVGSAYHSFTGNTTVPDIRGAAIRGKDNGRGLNPDGDLALGAYQSDTYGSHSHGQRAGGSWAGIQNMNYFSSWTSGSGLSISGATSTTQGWSSQSSNGGQVTTSGAGGNETRMKNVTANIFIKIN